MHKTLVAVVALVVLEVACTHVDAGHVGVEINSCSGGGVSDTPVPVGYHTTGACVSIVEFPVYMQTLILTKSANEGSPNDESITATDSDGLAISIDVTMSFTIDPVKVPGIYKKYRKDMEFIQSTFMRQTIREGVQEVFGRYKTEQLYGEVKEKSRGEIMGILVKKLEPDGFLINQFTINEWRFPKQVTEAIQAKVSMIQESQRAQQEVAKKEAEGRQAVAKAQGEAAASIARFEAEAKSIRAKADAQAYANHELAKSLTPALIEYMKIQKWNGVTPQVTGGGASFITLGK